MMTDEHEWAAGPFPPEAIPTLTEALDAVPFEEPQAVPASFPPAVIPVLTEPVEAAEAASQLAGADDAWSPVPTEGFAADINDPLESLAQVLQRPQAAEVAGHSPSEVSGASEDAIRSTGLETPLGLAEEEIAAWTVPASDAAVAGAPAAFFTPEQTATYFKSLLPENFEEQLVHRVMQRVDALLSVRVAEVIAVVVEQQTRSLVPSLREELEFSVRKTVYEAMADELADMHQAAPPGPGAG